ncbi:MAG: hypothetical protein ACTHKQ_05725 [Mesorhizobium sp.]
MKKTVIVAAMAALALSGCTKSVSEMSYTELKQYASNMVEKCQKQKVPKNELEACAMQEMRADQSRRMRQREIGAAISQASADYNRSIQANRPVNCTSTGYGNMVRTTCY